MSMGDFPRFRLSARSRLFLPNPPVYGILVISYLLHRGSSGPGGWPPSAGVHFLFPRTKGRGDRMTFTLTLSELCQVALVVIALIALILDNKKR